MNARELRIGNYIKVQGLNKPVPVSIIDTTETSEQTKCKPIPLTQDWLLSFGFEEYAISYYKLDEIYIHYANTGLHEYKLREFNVVIKYVHQLQNLYYALTGKELKLDA